MAKVKLHVRNNKSGLTTTGGGAHGEQHAELPAGGPPLAASLVKCARKTMRSGQAVLLHGAKRIMEQVIPLTLQMLGFGRTKLQGNLGDDRPRSGIGANRTKPNLQLAVNLSDHVHSPFDNTVRYHPAAD
jgi:hypothetical protein